MPIGRLLGVQTQEPATVVAVVVAYNRRELLLEVLEALAAQTHALSAVVVVDNASTDGSGDAAREAATGADVVTLTRNTGGAGGFAVGAARAMAEHHADWVWLMDDDTVPTATALAELLAAALADPEIVVAGSRVVWTDGQDHPMNTPRRKPFVSRAERESATRRGLLPVRSSSFVSMLARTDVIAESGLPIADYFIWNDDFEFSTRVLRRHRGVFVPGSVVVHKTAKLGATDVDPGERFYYEVRNKVWMLRRSRGLSPVEKAIYGGSTLRRWLRTFLGSDNKGVLRAGLRRGLRDGFRTDPRPNHIALAGLGQASKAVSLVERGHRPRGNSLGTGEQTADAAQARFSLLLPIYAADKPAYFAKAFTSSVNDQSRKPAEVVLVQDGPIGEELQAEVARMIDSSSVPVNHVVLPQNVGLARALTEGLEHCHNDIVARMDADDIALPHRFEVQIPALVDRGLDLVGSGLFEFAGDVGTILATRTPPVGADRIRAVARFRDPFNHPTVVYRKSAVERAGGYLDLGLMEDYWLFGRMVQANCVVDNVAEPLVMYRVNDGAYARRGGWAQLRAEVQLQHRFRRSGFTTRTQWLRNVAVRGGYRLVPERIRRAAYRRIIARKGIGV
ncbi:glycosyltransferase [Cryobacterium tepidiphilum]|uniref:Glycosyltransferase n=1 Tax=Cryobacterium tepidiphilum TaxID=2486026 RepID=A0A3M8L375_9MICO|nr:glycosyltransferase [Cryobacterium tepidiphilum]RNE59094.1 glycosyltransferase [Cryobacterium tepidiphilum]